MSERMRHAKVKPGAFRAMPALPRYVSGTGLGRRPRNLVTLRTSDINGCAFSVERRTKGARTPGESGRRLHTVPGWSETPFFTPRGRVAS